MLFRELLQGLNVLKIAGDSHVELRGITYDSRKAGPGFLFVAIKGFNSDGHDFIVQAIEHGAVAVITERETALPREIAWACVPDSRQALALLSAQYYGQPARKLKMVGITGTNGKTTTTNLIAAVCEAAGKKVGLLGTIHNRIGDEIIPGSHTTPESKDLQELLNKMSVHGTDTCVMEVSSHALALHRVAGCEFDLAVFTNFTQDHLDLHHSMENYLSAKLKLFRELQTPGRKGTVKHAVINADDPAAERFIEAAQDAGAMVSTYGIKSAADIYADEIAVRPQGVSFRVNGKYGSCQLNLRLTGLFNVYNALSAFSTTTVLGVPLGVIKDALEQVQGVPGRFAAVNAGQDFAVFVDYAHTPDGLKNTLQTARQLTNGRLITVYGCGGDRDRGKRPLMGQIAAKYSNYQIITADNPRTEDQDQITKDIIAGVQTVAKPADYRVEPNRRKAVAIAIRMARPDDVVVIAGKGHENYQIIGTEKIPFNDTQEVIRAIKLGSRE